MAEVSPMINGRWNRMPCNCCNDLHSAGRAAEKRDWRAEAEAELHDDTPEFVSYESVTERFIVGCDRCGRDIEDWLLDMLADQYLCGPCSDVVDIARNVSVIDLSDPMISVR